MNNIEDLLRRIEARSAVVGVIGLGYVGLPLALVFEEAGFRVIGFDVDAKKPEALHRGESYIRHIGPERVAAAYPGTTREEIVPRLDARGPKCGNRVVPSVN
jgi:UDP-N-acetyl-D-mannosaminuronate dehydrogenase